MASIEDLTQRIEAARIAIETIKTELRQLVKEREEAVTLQEVTKELEEMDPNKKAILLQAIGIPSGAHVNGE